MFDISLSGRRTLPTLPCKVYNGIGNRAEMTILTVSILVFTLLKDFQDERIRFIICGIIIFAWIILFLKIPKAITKTFLNSNTVTIEFENSIKTKTSIEDCVFYISTTNIKGTKKSYSYNVFLLSINKNGRKFDLKIPLRKRLLTPAEATEYVNNIQLQLDKKIDITYESEHIALECTTKQFIKK